MTAKTSAILLVLLAATLTAASAGADLTRRQPVCNYLLDQPGAVTIIRWAAPEGQDTPAPVPVPVPGPAAAVAVE